MNLSTSMNHRPERDMQTIAEQNGTQLGGPLSVLYRQRRDHVRLGHYLKALGRSEGPEQAKILLSIYRLVFPHAFAEEAVLWPVIRRVLPDGDVLTLRVEREHQAINELVRLLERMPLGSAGRQVALQRTTELLAEDVRDEEDLLLPRLQLALTPGQLRVLGVLWEAVRRIAPTRPHPIVSRRPPGNVLAALPLSFLDRLRDRVDVIALDQVGRGSDVLGSISTALQRASHAVEQLPGMRVGEDERTRILARPRSRRTALAIVAASGVGAALLFGLRRRTRGQAGSLASADR
jgi:hypothetical protein